jgi:hypothetical protein
VREWAALALERGVDTAVIEQALRQADRIEAWPVKKVPDASRIPADDAKQLRYAYSRRVWNLSIRRLQGPAYGAR